MPLERRFLKDAPSETLVLLKSLNFVFLGGKLSPGKILAPGALPAPFGLPESGEAWQRARLLARGQGSQQQSEPGARPNGRAVARSRGRAVSRSRRLASGLLLLVRPPSSRVVEFQSTTASVPGGLRAQAVLALRSDVRFIL